MDSILDHVVITTTVGDEDAAATLAAELVEGRLAACVQRMPVESTYRWKGKIESAHEVRLLAKTTAARADAVVQYIAEHHPYDTPEIIVTPITDGSAAYLAWITAETSPQGAA